MYYAYYYSISFRNISKKNGLSKFFTLLDNDVFLIKGNSDYYFEVLNNVLSKRYQKLVNSDFYKYTYKKRDTKNNHVVPETVIDTKGILGLEVDLYKIHHTIRFRCKSKDGEIIDDIYKYPVDYILVSKDIPEEEVDDFISDLAFDIHYLHIRKFEYENKDLIVSDTDHWHDYELITDYDSIRELEILTPDELK